MDYYFIEVINETIYNDLNNKCNELVVIAVNIEVRKVDEIYNEQIMLNNKKNKIFTYSTSYHLPNIGH